ncbi:hypothetical protein DU74_02075 [Methanosarcina mazei]|uniref:Uncharacterized protein n=1 Tax=Methanosarcina mazei TaxID=2209 RepID=A0A0F8R6G4_METMZ|nr:hypothetical protein DU74_02075 [Methanosarcina mazei]
MQEWTALIFLFFLLPLTSKMSSRKFIVFTRQNQQISSIILDKYIITSDVFNEEVVDGKRIRYVPLLYWLLE